MGFDKPICSLLSLPSDLDSTSRTFLLGFADGVVRAVLQCSDAWKVTARLKPHSGVVHAVPCVTGLSAVAGLRHFFASSLKQLDRHGTDVMHDYNDICIMGYHKLSP